MTVASSSNPHLVGKILGSLRHPGVLALTALSLLSLAFLVQPQFDPDFWWHVLVGQMILQGHFPHTDPFTYTAIGHSFIVQEWGSELLLSLLFRLGMVPVILFFVPVMAGAFWATLARARRYTHSAAILAGLLTLGLITATPTLGPRSQMFTFLGSALLLLVLRRHQERGGRQIYWLPALFCLWGNLHGGFSIGLGLFAVVLVAQFLTDRKLTQLLKTEVLVFLLSLITPLINPNGFGVYTYVVGLVGNSVAQSNIVEWVSPNFHNPIFWGGAATIFLAVLLGSKAKHASLVEKFLAMAGIALFLFAVRNLSILVVTTLPLLADGAEGWLADLKTIRPSAPPRLLALPFCLLIVAGSLVFGLAFAARNLENPENNFQSHAYATPVAKLLCQGPKSNVLTPYGSAGWLLYSLAANPGCSKDPTFVFGDVYVMGPTILQEEVDLAGGAPDSLSLLSKTKTQVVWEPTGSPLLTILQSTPTWTKIFADRTDEVYVLTSNASVWQALPAPPITAGEHLLLP